MADDTLPIVFRSKRLTGLVMTAVGAGIVAAGIAKAFNDSFSYSDDHFGPIVLSSQTTGWLMIAIGLPFALYALVTVVRGCPTLRLDDAGLLLNRCLQSPVSVPWSGLADVVIKRIPAPTRGRVIMVDVLFLVTGEGKEIGVGNIGEPTAIAETIRRIAARMKSAGRAGPASPPSPSPA